MSQGEGQADGTRSGVLLEHRLLEGANLYFPRPAVKLTFDVSGLAELPVKQARRLSRALGLRGAALGEPGTEMRWYACTRIVSALTRSVARRGGVARLAVRSRPGAQPGQVVVAVPWNHSGKVEAFAAGISQVLAAATQTKVDIDAALRQAGEQLAAAEPGSEPQLITPHVKCVGITGTNGKTTTSRMLAHIARTAGQHVAWSSTEGVHHDGRQIQPGDYSGPAGAREVFACEPLDLAVCETARGGILRKGIGVRSYDVTVVTNVSADHLGLDGVDTIDQLAEVKAVLPRVTHPKGWAVLNGDDPRVFAMRHLTKARPWVFSRDPASPSLRTALDEGGRGTTVLDGQICVLKGVRPEPVVALADVPMTLVGLSRANVENVLGVVSAALALGYTDEQVVAGVTSFEPERDNPGRMAIWRIDGKVVVLDLAHNEAGIQTLLEICAGLRPDSGRVLVNLNLPGDRGMDAFRRVGEIAGLNADLAVQTVTHKYLRGADPKLMGQWFAEGLGAAGKELSATLDTEPEALAWLVERAQPGDVVGFMAHDDREALKAWLRAHGGAPMDASEVRAHVLAL